MNKSMKNENQKEDFKNYLNDIEFLIDCHTHILPGLDDGAKTPKESSELIALSKSLNVKYICLTPHFFPENQSIQEFLVKREEAYGHLDDLVNIFMGAEVVFFRGLSNYPNLGNLCIGKTKYILIEMPLKKWSEDDVNEILMIQKAGLIPIISHFDQYLHFRNLKNIIRLKNEGCLIQSDAEYFLNKKTARKAIKYFNKSLIDLVASNVHDLEKKKQNLPEALLQIIQNAEDDCVYSLLGTYEEFVEKLIK